MTKERDAIRMRRLADPKGQPEVKEFLYEVAHSRPYIYRRTWLQAWSTAFRAAESAFEAARTRTAEWYRAGSVCSSLISARAELETLEIKKGTKMPEISQIGPPRVKQCKGEAGVARLAWWYLHKGKYHQWADPKLPDPQPRWSEGEFKALARVMEWGNASEDCTGAQEQRLLQEMVTHEDALNLPDIKVFRRILTLLFMIKYEELNPVAASKGRHARLAAEAGWFDIEILTDVLDEPWASDDLLRVLPGPTNIQFRRNLLRRALARLIRIWKTLDPEGVDYPDVPPPEELEPPELDASLLPFLYDDDERPGDPAAPSPPQPDAEEADAKREAVDPEKKAKP